MPIAERLGLLEEVTRGLVGRGTGCIFVGRPVEGMVLLGGAHELAIANNFVDIELNVRVLRTFFEQWGDPALGVALTKEGLEIARRAGSRGYGFQVVGNGTICALSVGEWEWASQLLDEWVAVEAQAAQRAEFYFDRSILKSHRGEPSEDDSNEAERLRVNAGITDPQWESYEVWGRAWAAFALGDLADAREKAIQAMEHTSYFVPLCWPLAVRSAVWAGDRDAARRVLDRPEIEGYAGALVDADRVTARAGVDALEGSWAAAIAGYREATRGYRAIGAAFNEAAAVVDMVALVPAAERGAADLEAAVAAARETLVRLGSKPFLAKLDAALASDPGPVEERPQEPSTTPAEAAITT
jgi:hypothetical protein